MQEIEVFKRDEHLRLPPDLDYHSLGYLSHEEKEKLTKYRPVTLGQAMRVDGLTPASLVILHALCKKNRMTREPVEVEAAPPRPLAADHHDVSDVNLL